MKALLIVGSPKGKASTSRAIGSALLRRLEAAGMEVDETTVGDALAAPDKQHEFLQAAQAADLLIFSFPLYVDQLPAPVIRTLELLAGQKPVARRQIAAIIQSGFPETHQNLPAAEIMRQFARETGSPWAGALLMGMGGAMNGKPLDKAGGISRHVVKALDLAAASLASGGDIPDQAAILFGKPLMPKFLYTWGANFGMKSQARKRGVAGKAYDRPYA